MLTAGLLWNMMDTEIDFGPGSHWTRYAMHHWAL